MWRPPSGSRSGILDYASSDFSECVTIALVVFMCRVGVSHSCPSFSGSQATLEPLSGKGSGIGGYTSSDSSWDHMYLWWSVD